MDRLTYDFPFNGGHCWQIHGTDNLECREVCERQGENGCIECPIAKAFDRLAAYENTGLEPEEIEPLCDMDRRAKMAEMLRIEEYFGVSIYRLRELVEAYREDRYIVLKEPRQAGVHRISELAQADREGRIKILTGFECPACGEKTLFARVDKAFYYCHSCNTRFTKEEAEKALKEREKNE